MPFHRVPAATPSGFASGTSQISTSSGTSASTSDRTVGGVTGSLPWRPPITSTVRRASSTGRVIAVTSRPSVEKPTTPVVHPSGIGGGGMSDAGRTAWIDPDPPPGGGLVVVGVVVVEVVVDEVEAVVGGGTVVVVVVPVVVVVVVEVVDAGPVVLVVPIVEDGASVVAATRRGRDAAVPSAATRSDGSPSGPHAPSSARVAMTTGDHVGRRTPVSLAVQRDPVGVTTPRHGGCDDAGILSRSWKST